MAVQTLTPQIVGKAGVTPTFNAIDATDSFQFRNSPKTILYFKNTGGSIATITFDTPGTVSGEAIANPTFTVPATTGEIPAAMVPTSLFNNASGFASFTCDQASGVTVAILEVD